MPSPTARFGRPARRRLLLGGLVAVVVAIGAVTLVATTGSTTSYRTATVSRGSIAQTLTTTGVLSPVRSADVDFQVAGTVAKVRAAIGHKVLAGQTLAWLDRSSLQAALGAARSQLTNARERLSEDETSEDSATTSTTADSTTSATAASTTAAAASLDAAHPSVVNPRPTPSGSRSGPPAPGSGAPHGVVTTATLTHDQQAIRVAQRATDADLATAKTALATETTACATPGTTTPTSASTPAGALTCTQAAEGLQHDQQRVNDDETAVDVAEQTLSRDLATATKALQSKQKSSSSTSSHRQAATGSTATRASFVTVTAADIATDQATIDSAAAEVATAKGSLRQATLTAPMNGTVVAVTIGNGDTVSGTTSSTSPAIEIVGSQQDKTTVYLSDTQVRTIKIGMHANVTPDGASRPVTGDVVAIGLTGTEADSGSVTYPVTINVAEPARSLVAGADAAVSITLATANGVIAVPTSAVHYQGATTYVDLVTAGKLTRHTVTVSTVGPALTEVTSGLTVGQRVVLANLDAAVPSSSTTTLNRGGFGGGFGGPGGFVVRVRGAGGGTGQTLVGR